MLNLLVRSPRLKIEVRFDDDTDAGCHGWLAKRSGVGTPPRWCRQLQASHILVGNACGVVANGDVEDAILNRRLNLQPTWRQCIHATGQAAASHVDKGILKAAPRCLRHRPVTRGVGSRRQEGRALRVAGRAARTKRAVIDFHWLWQRFGLLRAGWVVLAAGIC